MKAKIIKVNHKFEIRPIHIKTINKTIHGAIFFEKLILLPLFIFFEFQIEFLKNDYLNLITTIVIGFMMISKIPTISIKKLKINPKYKTWIFLIFVLVCVALISRIWITLICVIGAYLISVFYTIIKSRNIKN